jgi:hypothetical protein
MPAGELIERVSQLIASHREGMPADVQAAMAELEARLREPLRIAVAGRVKAGKSTLVNALLGQRVAPTDVSECTRVVTWFRYGHPERLQVALRDGGTLDAQLTSEGMLPAELPVPIDQVASLHAFLANTSLQEMTLIDTPGLGSVHDDYSRSTRELLARDSSDATSDADAVVFLLGSAMMADELETLRLFQIGGEHRGSAANAVGVLSHADQLGDGTQDPWTVAVELAAKYSATFRNEVATVVPVIGLIAETAEAALLTEPQTARLRRLADLDAKERARMLWSADHFVTSSSPLSVEERAELLGLLDLYGVARATDALAEGLSGASALRARLSELSGVSAVKESLAAHFGEQAQVLKAGSALDVLARLGYGGADGTRPTALSQLRNDVEALRMDAAMHPIAEHEVAHEVSSGTVTLPDELLDELHRLFAPGPAESRLGIASSDPAALAIQGYCCRVVMRSYQLIWEQAAQ